MGPTAGFNRKTYDIMLMSSQEGTQRVSNKSWRKTKYFTHNSILSCAEEVFSFFDMEANLLFNLATI